MISTHAPLAGRDETVMTIVSTLIEFQPTRPLRGATDANGNLTDSGKFQPTRPLRGATSSSWSIFFCGRISTHAPLAGRDRSPSPCATISRTYFNPRAPCGARLFFSLLPPKIDYFNPRAPCGARRKLGACDFKRYFISTHAPLAGRDSKSVQITMHIFAITDKFQMLLHRMPPVRAFCSFLMQENHADFGCEPPK